MNLKSEHVKWWTNPTTLPRQTACIGLDAVTAEGFCLKCDDEELLLREDLFRILFWMYGLICGGGGGGGIDVDGDKDHGAVCALCCMKQASLFEGNVCSLNYCSNFFKTHTFEDDLLA